MESITVVGGRIFISTSACFRFSFHPYENNNITYIRNNAIIQQIHYLETYFRYYLFHLYINLFGKYIFFFIKSYVYFFTMSKYILEQKDRDKDIIKKGLPKKMYINACLHQ